MFLLVKPKKKNKKINLVFYFLYCAKIKNLYESKSLCATRHSNATLLEHLRIISTFLT
jgi:hypothetical protein